MPASRALLAGALLAMTAGCQSPKPAPSESEPTAAATGSSAPAPATSAAAAPTESGWDRLQALGTEPFWSVEVATGTLRYSTPENIDGTFFPAERLVEGTRQTYSGVLDGKRFTLVIEPGPCSDGMSDTVYPLKATRTLGDDVQRGCARPK